VDTNYTMVAKLAKRYLPGADAFDGVHARLRATGAAYLAQR
jgi:amidase